jgi:hypothetical protein
VRRVRALFVAHEMPAGGAEWPKPDYTLPGHGRPRRTRSRRGRPDLPINLPTILGDLDAMRSAAQQSGPSWCWRRFLAGEGRHGAGSGPPPGDP